MTKPITEPLSIQQVFAHSFSLFKKAWTRLLPITILLGVIILSPSLWFFNRELHWLFIGYFIFSTFSFCTILFFMESLERRRSMTLVKALKYASKKILTVLVVSVLMTFLTLLGYIFLIVPGIILTVWLSMCVPLILFEDANPINVWRRSYELTTDEWWRTALIVFLPIALLSLIGLPLQEAVWFKVISLHTFRVLRDILFIIVCLVYFPWVASLFVIQYEDLKRRQAIRRLRGTPLQYVSEPKN